MTAHEELILAAGGIGLYQRVLIVIHYMTTQITGAEFAFMNFAGQNVNASQTEFLNHSIVTASKQFYTIGEEWGLVGEEFYVVKLIISIQMVGMALGMGFGGALADRFGRRKLLRIVICVQPMVAGVQLLSNQWELFAITRFFVGFLTAVSVQTTIVLVIESIPMKWRILASTAPFSPGVFMVGVYGLISDSWRHMTMMIYWVSPIVFAMLLFFVQESPKWAAEKGGWQKSVIVFEKIGKMNKQKSLEGMRSRLKKMLDEDTCANQQTTPHVSPMYLFRSFKSSFLLVRLGAVQFLISAFDGAMFFNIGELSGSVAINLMLVSSGRILVSVGVLVCDRLFEKLGRKTILIPFLSLIAVFQLTHICLALTAGKRASQQIRIMGIGSLMMYSIVYTASNALTLESFPTLLRGLGYGAASIPSFLGVIICPQIDLLTKSFSLAVPVFVGCCCLLTVMIVASLDETKGTSLPGIETENIIESKNEF